MIFLEQKKFNFTLEDTIEQELIILLTEQVEENQHLTFWLVGQQLTYGFSLYKINHIKFGILPNKWGGGPTYHLLPSQM